MSESYEFHTYRDVDYVNALNRAIQYIFTKRASVSDIVSYYEYLRAVEALYVILIPRLKSREIYELIKNAKRIARKGGKTLVRLELLDKALELMINNIDKAGLLIKGVKVELGRE